MATPAGFDWATYVAKYPDLQAAGIDTPEEAAQHWNSFGQNEGRTFQDPAVNNTAVVSNYVQSQPAYDINGNPIQLQDGYKLGGGLFGNAIFNDKGQGVGQYYNSPEDAAYWKQRTQQAMGGTAVVGGGMTLEQQRQNLQNTLNTGGIDAGVTKPSGTSFQNVGGGPALESQGFLSQLMQMMQQMQGDGQGYNPQQQYSPYAPQGYNPFGSQYGNYNPFGNQYSSYSQPPSYSQPVQASGGAAPGTTSNTTQAYTPSNNVNQGQQGQGQSGSFSPGYQPYDMGFRHGNMPNFGPLSQLQANAMYA